jgi:hypothetical protein
MIGVVVLAATWSAVDLPSSARDVPGDAHEEPEPRRGVRLAIWCTIISSGRPASVTKVSWMSGVSR